MDNYNSTIEIFRSNDQAKIFRVIPNSPIRIYIPGQYGSLGLLSDSGTKLIKRAYSISSSIIDFDTKKLLKQRDLKYLEFYINKVSFNNSKKEQITPKLFNLINGDRIFCGNKIVGHYIFDNDERWKNILLISTHTGESPNNSIINKILLDKREINICNINVGHNWKSLYYKEHDLLQKIYTNYKFLQFEDKSKTYKDLTGFVLNFCNNEINETQKIGFNFDKDTTLIMLCGDPKMIGAPIKKGGWEYIYPNYGLINIFKDKSLELTTRFKKGNIIYESYW